MTTKNEWDRVYLLRERSILLKIARAALKFSQTPEARKIENTPEYDDLQREVFLARISEWADREWPDNPPGIGAPGC